MSRMSNSHRYMSIIITAKITEMNHKGCHYCP